MEAAGTLGSPFLKRHFFHKKFTLGLPGSFLDVSRSNHNVPLLGRSSGEVIQVRVCTGPLTGIHPYALLL